MSREEYLELIKKIEHHMDLYYNQDAPEISDFEYDRMMLQLKEAEKDHPEWVNADSPSQKIGGVAKREAGVKVTHDVPMLSIEDVFTKEEVVVWVDKVKALFPDCSFSVETKIDGLSLTLRYQRQEDNQLHLTLAETRGDGLVGEDVTANALVIPDVKKVIDLPYESLQLRGEVYMRREDFERFNSEQEELGKKTAANPRNLAAGTLRQLDPAVTRERSLSMFVFNVQQGPDEMPDSHVARMELLAKKKVPVVFHKRCTEAEEILSAIDEIAAMRGDLEYDIDGAVIKIDDTHLREEFPTGSKYSSGHIAYKYPPEERIVVMDEILVDVGRTGKLTFTGVFHDRETGKPARLCGTSVSRATLHNQNYINDMKITQEHAKINRYTIASQILQHMNLHEIEIFDTIHNYIDTDNMILRKGSISAQANEKVIIPMNMRDGSLICIGKGNPEWNYSAPHGAGRIMSRNQAREQVSLEEFKVSMKDIFSTCVNENTIDESPMVYKPMNEIIDNIKDTVDIIDIIKPIYNFKAYL